MKFKNFDRKNLNNLRYELQVVLAKYGISSNLQFEVGAMSFSDAEVKITVKAKVNGATTVADSHLAWVVKTLGLVMEKNGARLVRYDRAKWKMPFIYEMGGKMYKCDENRAKQMFCA
jgi:hypothetical protein